MSNDGVWQGVKLLMQGEFAIYMGLNLSLMSVQFELGAPFLFFHHVHLVVYHTNYIVVRPEAVSVA